MRDLILLHAKADAAAEPIAAVLGERTLARFAIGDRRPQLRASATTVVIWTAEAQARGWDAFAHLIADEARVFLVTVGGIAQPQTSRRIDGAFVWERDGVNGLLSVLRRTATQQTTHRRGGLFRMLANAFAVFGLFAVASGTSASAAPLDHASREANMSPGERMVSQRDIQSELAMRGLVIPPTETSPALDIDVLAPVPASYEQVATALTDAWLQPTMEAPSAVSTQTTQFSFFPGFRI
jgi:hypothetical protein